VISRAHRRVVWTSPAEQDLTDAALWYAAQQSDLVELFLSAVRDAAIDAASAPESYARVRGNLRRVLVRRFPYALIIRESTEELVVVACYHLHRDPRVWQSRG
jgi:plasmid stabilization system protein ParE